MTKERQGSSLEGEVIKSFLKRSKESIHKGEDDSLALGHSEA